MTNCANCDKSLENGVIGYYKEYPLCQMCYDKHLSFEGKKEARIERLEGYTENVKAESARLCEEGYKRLDVIPFGQPILIGHHSEKRDRNYRQRAVNLLDKSAELYQKAEELERKVKSAKSNNAISSDDPLCVVKLTERIEECESAQKLMVAANKAIRKTLPDKEACVNALIELGMSEKWARDIMFPPKWRTIGFADFETRNNGANTRRLKERLIEAKERQTKVEELKDKPEQTTEEVTLIEGLSVKVERNIEEGRLQLFFNRKPDENVRTILKSNGWRWSPSNSAWQRYLNNGSEWSLTCTINRIKELESK